MGRVMKRVPLNFSWPMGKVWTGYINPHPPSPCSACDCSGYNPETKEIADAWYAFDDPNSDGWSHELEQSEVDALVEAERLWDFTRVPRTPEQRAIVEKKMAEGGNCWLPESNGYKPTAEEVNEWSRQGFGHDAINRSICVRSRAERLGVFGLCETCGGEGHFWSDPEEKEKYEAFEHFEPPIGGGYQLWETTSEGSPTSPVFKSLEELAAWCETNATTFGPMRASKEEWMKMLEDDFVYHQSGNKVFM